MQYLGSVISLIAGALVAGLGLASFLQPNHFIDGGVTGISMLLADIFGLPLALLLVVVNTPFIALGYRHIGRTFAVKSFLTILGLAVALLLVPYPVATEDKLLGAFFGGFFVGAGVGLIPAGGVPEPVSLESE